MWSGAMPLPSDQGGALLSISAPHRRRMIEQIPAPTANIAETLDDQPVNLLHARLRREVRRLPLIERKVITWRYGLEGMELTHQEIADRLEIAAKTSWKIEQQALAMLRAAFGLVPNEDSELASAA
jgi:DNA-directed RNA polymerase specialized sigma subunit